VRPPPLATDWRAGRGSAPGIAAVGGDLLPDAAAWRPDRPLRLVTCEPPTPRTAGGLAATVARAPVRRHAGPGTARSRVEWKERDASASTPHRADRAACNSAAHARGWRGPARQESGGRTSGDPTWRGGLWGDGGAPARPVTPEPARDQWLQVEQVQLEQEHRSHVSEQLEHLHWVAIANSLPFTDANRNISHSKDRSIYDQRSCIRDPLDA
jgi:hypothetical protein